MQLNPNQAARRKSELIRTFTAIAKVQTIRSDLSVSIGGDQAKTDYSTVFLPDGDLDLQIGCAYHENGHNKHSCPKVLKLAVAEGQFINSLRNAIEDVRMERLVCNEFPGARKALSRMIDAGIERGWFSEGGDKKGLPEATLLSGYILYYLRSTYMEQKQLATAAIDYKTGLVDAVGIDLVNELTSLLDRLPVLKTPKGSLELAREIVLLFKNSDSSDSSDDSDDSGNSEGSGSSDDSSGSGNSEVSGSNDDSNDSGNSKGSGSNDDSNGSGNSEGSGSSDDSNGSGNSDGSGSNGDSNDSGNSDGSGSNGDSNDSGNSEGSGSSDDSNDSGNSQQSGQNTGSDSSSGSSSPKDYQGAQVPGQFIQSCLDADASELPIDLHEAFREAHEQDVETAISNGVITASEASFIGVRRANVSSGFDYQAALRASGQVKHPLKRVLNDMNTRNIRFSDSGRRIDSRRLAHVAVNKFDVFRTDKVTKAPNTAITLLVDRSCSMRYSATVNGVHRPEGWLMNTANESAYALANAIDSLKGAKSEVLYYPFNEGSSSFLHVAKSFEEKATNVQQHFQVDGRGGTPTGEAINIALRSLALRKEPRKMLFVITDGQANNAELVKQAVQDAMLLGISVVAFGIGCSDVKGFDNGQFVHIHNIMELKQAVKDAIASDLLKVA